MQEKSFGGYMAFNIDIRKVFDTIDWLNLIKVI